MHHGDPVRAADVVGQGEEALHDEADVGLDPEQLQLPHGRHERSVGVVGQHPRHASQIGQRRHVGQHAVVAIGHQHPGVLLHHLAGESAEYPGRQQHRVELAQGGGRLRHPRRAVVLEPRVAAGACSSKAAATRRPTTAIA